MVKLKHWIPIIFSVTLIALAASTMWLGHTIFYGVDSETKHMPVVISYPDSMFMPFYGEDAPICTVKFLLEYNGTLSEKTHVKITNSSCWSYVPYNITVYVGIPQAIRYEDMDIIGDNTTRTVTWGGTDILIFHDNFKPTDSPFKPISDYHVIYPSLEEEIYFPVAGDYAPIILIGKQGEESNPIIYKYEQIKIHVASETEVEGLNINKFTLGITVVLFTYAWIEELVLLYKLVEKWRNIKKDENDDGQLEKNKIKDPIAKNETPPSNIENAKNRSKSPNHSTNSIDRKEENNKE